VIFLTVGTQLSFDRLVSTVDSWAGGAGHEDVFAQIGPNTSTPRHLEWVSWLDPAGFRRKVQEASLIISHAGMGSVLTALEFNKPIIVLPRKSALGEHRNDHQLATAKWLAQEGRVSVAMDEDDLTRMLDSRDGCAPPGEIRPWASEDLLEAIRGFLAST
jgi:UDP-N-acetylglucosamine transferase subunit ALG13